MRDEGAISKGAIIDVLNKSVSQALQTTVAKVNELDADAPVITDFRLFDGVSGSKEHPVINTHDIWEDITAARKRWGV